MKGREIVQELERRRGSGECFIRWQGTAEGEVGYETLEGFRGRVAPDEEVAGWELLDLEEMWDALEALCPENVARERRPEGDVIVWSHDSGAGEMVSEECPFDPEAVMTIFAMESRGRTLS